MKQYFNLSVRSVGLRQLRGIHRLLSDVNSLLISDKVFQEVGLCPQTLSECKDDNFAGEQIGDVQNLIQTIDCSVSIDEEEHEGIMRMKLSKTKWRCR